MDPTTVYFAFSSTDSNEVRNYFLNLMPDVQQHIQNRNNNYKVLTVMRNSKEDDPLTYICIGKSVDTDEYERLATAPFDANGISNISYQRNPTLNEIQTTITGMISKLYKDKIRMVMVISSIEAEDDVLILRNDKRSEIHSKYPNLMPVF